MGNRGMGNRDMGNRGMGNRDILCRPDTEPQNLVESRESLR